MFKDQQYADECKEDREKARVLFIITKMYDYELAPVEVYLRMLKLNFYYMSINDIAHYSMLAATATELDNPDLWITIADSLLKACKDTGSPSSFGHLKGRCIAHCEAGMKRFPESTHKSTYSNLSLTKDATTVLQLPESIAGGCG